MDEIVTADRRPAVLDLAAGTYYWCRCGRSARQPFCAGSHEVTGLVPVEFTLDQPIRVALCQCKHSGNKPFCDGTHKEM